MNWLSLTPELRGLLKPGRRFRIVRLDARPFRDEHGEIVHGPSIAGFGGLLVPDRGQRSVARDPDAFLVEGADPIFRGRKTLRGGPVEPEKCGVRIARHGATIGKAGSKFILRSRIAGGGGRAQGLRRRRWDCSDKVGGSRRHGFCRQAA